MRTRFVPLMTLGLALVGCAVGSPEPGEVALDADTTEVLATSEATLSDDAHSESPALEVSASIDDEVAQVDALAVDPIPTASFTLRRGETLAHYARWSGVPVEDIAQSSELDLGGSYPVGTEVIVPIGSGELGALTAARDAHHTARAEAYLASRGGSRGSTFVMVRSGDTAWSIAKDNERIPVWLLESYNPAIDLERLRPGQELMIPLLSDGTVAEVDEEVVEQEDPEIEDLASALELPVTDEIIEEPVLIDEEIPDVLPQ